MDILTIKIISLVILLFLSAFFSSAETAMTMTNQVKIRLMAEEHNKRARILLRIFEQQRKMLTCILIGNNLVNISASSLTATIAQSIWGSIGVSIATAILTLLVLLFGEITPKTLAAGNPEQSALYYAPVIYFLMKIFTPIILLVDCLSNFIMGLMSIDPEGADRSMTEGELRTYVDVGHEDGAIEAEEKEMIHNVFDFSDSEVKDIMIPRINLCIISADTDYDTLLQTFRDNMYTRLPVYEDSPENITGIVNVKDMIFVENKRDFLAKDILRQAYYTYEQKKTADLMEELRNASMTVAFILDEYGSCVGMVTLEDLIEEIVGEIRDEYDQDEMELIQALPDGTYLIEGSMKLDDINDALDTNIVSEEYDSIGGLLMGTLDKLPESGESIKTPGGYIITAGDISSNRVENVRLTLPEK